MSGVSGLSGLSALQKRAGGEDGGDPIGDALRADAVAYWKMDEASETRVDATGNGNDLTPMNTPSGTTGKVGNGVGLTATSTQYLKRADNADLSTGQTDFTFTFWVKFNSLPVLGERQDIIIKRFEVYEPVEEITLEYEIYIATFDPGGTLFSYSSSDPVKSLDLPSSPEAQVDTWYFVEVAFDWGTPPTASMRINNGSPNTYSEPDYVGADNAGDFNIGYDSFYARGAVDGIVDEVGFWKRLLTTDERSYLYNSGNGKTLYP